MNPAVETTLRLLAFVGFLVIWIAPIFLGLKAAREKNRSPHRMWFGIHPISGWLAFLILRYVPALLECPDCGETMKAHARVCAYCLRPFRPAETVT